MPQLNEVAEFGINQLIARRLTTPGPAPSPTVEPALFPAIVLENDRPEFGYPKGERLAAARSSQAAVAGQVGVFNLLNPIGSNIIVTVTRTTFAPGASAVLVKLSAQAFAGAPVAAAVRDTRWSLAGALLRPVAQASIGTQVGAAPEAPIAWGNSNTTTDVNVPIVLTPGWNLRIECQTANIQLNNGEFQWYERTAQPGEI